MCSVTCGGGLRHRDVYCAEVISGNLTKVTYSKRRPHRLGPGRANLITLEFKHQLVTH